MPTPATDGATAESTTMSPAMSPSLGLPDALEGGLGHTLVQMGGAVVLVVALILVLQKVANRYRLGGGKGRDAGIEIVSQRALGNRLSLLVVETHGHTLLLGTSPQGVTSLADLGAGRIDARELTWDDRLTPSPLSSVPADAPAGRVPAFKAALTRAVGGRSRNDAVSGLDERATTVAVAKTATEAKGKVRRSSAKSETPPPSGRGAGGMIRSIAARAVSRRPDNVPRSALADLEEASRIAREARERDERLAQTGAGEPVDLQEFETQFRDKLRAIREKYTTLDEAEGRRA